MIGFTEAAEEKMKYLVKSLEKDNMGIRMRLSYGYEGLYELTVDEIKENDEVNHISDVDEKPVYLVINKAESRPNVIIDYLQRQENSVGSFVLYYPSMGEMGEGVLTDSIRLFAVEMYKSHKDGTEEIFSHLNSDYMMENGMTMVMEEIASLSELAVFITNDLEKLYSRLVVEAESTGEGCSVEYTRTKNLLEKFSKENGMDTNVLVEGLKGIVSKVSTEMAALGLQASTVIGAVIEDQKKLLKEKMETGKSGYVQDSKITVISDMAGFTKDFYVVSKYLQEHPKEKILGYRGEGDMFGYFKVDDNGNFMVIPTDAQKIKGDIGSDMRKLLGIRKKYDGLSYIA